MKVASEKELISKLYDMNQKAMECISLLQNAFIFNSSKSLDECEAKINAILQAEKALTGEFLEDAKVDPDSRGYVSVPGYIERMGDFIEDIAGCIRIKIREGILFSDKAISETTFLLERLQNVLRNTSDIILSRNVVLREYVKESTAEISRSANDFATMHEDRLIEGLCMPMASPLYLHMLDAIKGIAWHGQKIAEKLTTA
jgi:Na+/phosphate symporter